ncbi:MAG: hypothetical protein GC191_10895 [Azospirillum sp.]|nr:hypothetical protein [Azospirillum sp.]
MLPDYARAAGGLALTVVPLLAVPVSPWLAVPMLSAAGLFAVFLITTVRRQVSRIAVDDHAIRSKAPFGHTALRWAGLTKLRLRYFSTRRDRERGWLQLILSGADVTLRLDSALDRFDQVVSRAAAAAARNGLGLDPATVDNLAALGINGSAEKGLPEPP